MTPQHFTQPERNCASSGRITIVRFSSCSKTTGFTSFASRFQKSLASRATSDGTASLVRQKCLLASTLRNYYPKRGWSYPLDLLLEESRDLHSMSRWPNAVQLNPPLRPMLVTVRALALREVVPNVDVELLFHLAVHHSHTEGEQLRAGTPPVVYQHAC